MSDESGFVARERRHETVDIAEEMTRVVLLAVCLALGCVSVLSLANASWV